MRTLVDPAEIPLEPALTDNERQSKLEAQAPVDGHPWSPGVTQTQPNS
jgi:hypothetical protein